jgi:hypothetical protein
MRGMNRIGISALLAGLLAAGCSTGNGYKSSGGSPTLGAAVTRQGNFSSGEQGAGYTITVSNTGTAATSGTVTVGDPPTGFMPTQIGGPLWSCTLATMTCTNSNSLAAGQSFTKITVTGNVTSPNGTPVSIPLTLSGGGAATVTVTPTPTITVAAVSLSITKAHLDNFKQGQQGATYTVKVSNGTSAGSTSGTVTVTEIPPAGGGLRVTGMTGTNWTCTVATLTCMRSDSLAGGASYDPITVTVNVSVTATSPLNNQVMVSGGGSANANAPDATTMTGGGTSACPLPTLGNENLLNGTYVSQFDGWSDPILGVQGPIQEVAVFVTDGAGGVTGGEMDSGAVRVGVGVTSQPTPTLVTFSSGCYQLGSDLRGLIIWNLPAVSGGTASVTFAFSLNTIGTGTFMEFDDANPGTNPGTRGTGVFFQQTRGPFTTLASFGGSYVFETRGYSPDGANSDYLRSAAIGRFDDSPSGTVSNGMVDVASTKEGLGTQTNVDNQIFTGNFTTAPDSLGRGNLMLSFTSFDGQGPLTLNFAYYIIDPTFLWLKSIDTPDNKGHSLVSVEVMLQTGPFGPGSLNGNMLLNMTGADLSPSHSFTVTGIGQVNSLGTGDASIKLDEVLNGNVVAKGTDPISGGSFAVSPNGRGVLTFGTGSTAKKFSVAMIAQNGAFLLEGTQDSPGSNLIFGTFDPQRAPLGGFVDGTFSGLYVFRSVRPASTNSGVESGSLTATPTTNANPSSLSGKIDHSDGLESCSSNCLQTDQAISGTYSVDANGRITITSSGGGTAVGWLSNQNRPLILSDITDANGTVLSAHH